MATNIRLKSSAVAGKTPTLSDLSLRELAVNTVDGKLFLRKGTGIATDTIRDLSDHGSIDGLADDDHLQYIHTTNTRTGVTAEFNTTGKITTTNNVGIGITTPTEKLHVSGNAIIEANSSTNALRITQTGTGNALVVEDSTNPDSTPFVVTATGAVVIGNNQPLVTYDGYASWVSVLVPTGNDSALVFRGNNGSTTSGTAQTLRLLVGGSGSSASGTILAHDSNDGTGTQVRRNNIRFYDTGISFEQSNNTDVLTVDTINARVGIGTTTPTSKLEVVGTIKASNYKGVVNNDYVFSPDSSSTLYGDVYFTTSSLVDGQLYIGENELSSINQSSGKSFQFSCIADSYIDSYNFGIGTTNPTELLDVNGKIKTNNSVLISDSQLTTTTTTRTSSSAQFTADTFPSTAYRSTKYLVEVRETSTSNFYTTEILLMHDGTEVYMTQYGTLQTNVSPVSSIDSDINSGNVRLLITPSVANTITKISRISLTA